MDTELCEAMRYLDKRGEQWWSCVSSSVFRKRCVLIASLVLAGIDADGRREHRGVAWVSGEHLIASFGPGLIECYAELLLGSISCGDTAG